MDDDRINEILKKQEETLILAQKLWRAEKWRRFFSILMYLVYLGVILGTFYFLSPYIEHYLGLIQSFGGNQSPQELQKILEPLLK